MLSILFKSLGGLGLFLFGMKIMSEGLQTIAGKKMRQILGMVSNNRLIGCCVGALITSIIQSSSAATVMLVSFVDAGLMTLVQAVGVILGANIGTTITAQLIAFNIHEYALPAIAIGVLFKFFIGRRKWIYFGDVLLGFGMLFYGLATMKAGLSPLRESESFLSFLTGFDASSTGGILLCVVAGTMLTIILQSSSATVGIAMALASQGLLNFETSVAFILGDNIGTTITAELASIGANANARRTARAHTLFNVIGVFLIITFFPIFIKIVCFISGTIMHSGPLDLIIGGEKPNISRYLANSHTIFNVINALIFLFFLPHLVKAATYLTSLKEVDQKLDELHHIKFLDAKFVGTPSVALTQAKAEVIRMGQGVQVMYYDVINSLEARSLKGLAKWRKREDTLDTLQREITRYLVKVTQEHISPEESGEIRSLLRMVNNFERIGDAIEDVAELSERLIKEDLYLSDDALSDYDCISEEVQKFLTLLMESMSSAGYKVMDKAREIESNINKMEKRMKEDHLTRLQQGICDIDSGMIFVNILTAFQRMGGFCFNIAQAAAGVK
jgi:phosphate:Na+ symporter